MNNNSTLNNIECSSLHAKLLQRTNSIEFYLNETFCFEYVIGVNGDPLKNDMLLGKKVTSIIDPEFRSDIDLKISNIDKYGNETTEPIELKASIGGKIGWYEFFLYKSFNENETIDKRNKRYYGALYNIDRKKKKENDLALQLIKVLEKNKLKSEFLANMSHEIRTPLNGIVGFSSIIERGVQDIQKRNKYLRIIKTSAKQLLSLINDLIDISKIEASQLKINKKEIEINQLLGELYEIFHNEIPHKKAKNLKVDLLLPDGIKTMVISSDEVRLKQIFTNLLHNALKFTESGKIVFGYSLSPSSVIFYVEDTGVGIEPDRVNDIFSRYKQASEGAKQMYQGSGLGLSITKDLVSLLGGTIDVSSKQGEGTKFTFRLPRL